MTNVRHAQEVGPELPSAGIVIPDQMQDLLTSPVELETLLQTIPVAILLLPDPFCHRIHMNRVGYELFRLPPGTNICDHEPGTGPPFCRFFNKGRLVPCEELPLFKAAQLGQVFFDEELELRFADGTARWIQGNVVPLRSASGVPEGALGAFVEITERKKAEDFLRRSEERFRTMAEILPDFIFTVDPDGGNEYANQRYYEYTGLPPGGARGQGWVRPMHPKDRERTKAEWTEALAIGRPFESQLRIRSATGEYRWFLVRARPVRDANGKILEWFGAAADIESQKRAEEQLEQTVVQRTAKLKETIGELEHYSYSITHDLRAPLRAIHGFAKMLEDNMVTDAKSRAEYLERIITSAKRMDKLLQDTLNYGKVLREELPMERVDIAALLWGIIESYPNLQLPHAEVILEESFPPVLGNQAALTHCCSNLLDNAVKFVAPGTRPRVRVWAESRGEWVRLWFKDNGIGIAKEVQDRIFAMFQKLDKRFEGTGIGLAIVRKAVERMGGKVGVESEPGHGSKFWLDLRPANQGTREKADAQLCDPVCGGRRV